MKMSEKWETLLTVLQQMMSNSLSLVLIVIFSHCRLFPSLKASFDDGP